MCTEIFNQMYRNVSSTSICRKDTFTLPRLNDRSATKSFCVDETLQTLAESVRYFKRLPEDTFVQPRPAKRLHC